MIELLLIIILAIAFNLDHSPARHGVIYAGFWLRLGALLLDIILINCILLGIFVIFFVSYYYLVREDQITESLTTNCIIFYAIVIYLYHTLLESSKYQATLGKMILRLRVVDLNCNRISFARANLRLFGKAFSYLMVAIFNIFGCILFFMAGWTKKSRLCMIN